jgi:hypothetical protein
MSLSVGCPRRGAASPEDERGGRFPTLPAKNVSGVLWNFGIATYVMAGIAREDGRECPAAERLCLNATETALASCSVAFLSGQQLPPYDLR